MITDWSSLEGVGYAAVALAYLGHAAWFARDRRLQAPSDRTFALYRLAVLSSGLWGLLGWIDLASPKLWPGLAAEQLDQGRYALWCLTLLAIAPAHRRAAWGRWATLAALFAAGAAANLWIGLTGEVSVGAGRSMAAVHLGWPILSTVLVEQVYRGEAEDRRWGAKPLCLALLALCAYDIFL